MEIRLNIADDSKEFFQQMFVQHKAIMLLIEPESGRILDANRAAAFFYGYSVEELGRMFINDLNILPPEEVRAERDKAFNEERNYFIFPHKLANGEIRTVEVYSSPVKIKDYSLLFSVIHDVTERVKMENRVKTLLEEKELILREVHHRIKNNMSAIKGMLELQIDTLDNKDAVAALQVAESRIHSMVVLYDKLHVSRSINELMTEDYFSDLVDGIISLFPNSDHITVNKEIENFRIGQQNLFIIGIIINELLTNIMKYAFSQCTYGSIMFKAGHKGDRISIEISDDGRGLPEDFDLRNSKGFGLQLVSMLTEQAGGTISTESVNGARFILDFPVE